MAFKTDDDQIFGKAYDSRLVKRLLRYVRPYRSLIFMSIGFLLVSSACHLAGPYLIKVSIDDYISARDMIGLSQIALIYFTILIARFIFQFSEIYITQYVGQHIMYDLRREIFAYLQKLPLVYFDRNPVGRLITRVTSDVDALNEAVSSGMIAIFGNIFSITGIVVIMLWMDWKLALVTFAVLPFLFTIAFLFKVKVRILFREVRGRLAVINSFLQENITGMHIVQLFNREHENFRRFDAVNKEYLQANLDTIFHFAIFFPAVRLLSVFAIALIIWYGGGRIIHETLTFGILIGFIQYAELFYRPIQELSEKYNIFQSAMASSERIFKLLDEPVAIDSKPTAHPITLFQHEIEFRHVWFAYDRDNFVLEDVCFTIGKGESIAIVGATGSGKTTIISLLCRFYDVNKGQILIDGIDIRDYDLHQLRQMTAIVLQDVFLFSGTIEENIRLGNREFNSDRTRRAAEQTRANPFIQKLPNGYNQEVKERGGSLSVGQRQLLSFSRALAFDPQILILDEATSNIDTETEILIQEGINELMKNRTSIIIAHRLSTIKHVDRIIAIHKGIIREIGCHDALLANKGIYYKLYQLQYKEQKWA
ncbi:MAG: antibiotic ABC transporter ATP-binding protein [Candidatus Cloacimonetes bacterium 4572_55]|nr:MAG: antibiotic ABC transporter ATP-binding protein [Candidatus Cloacimonetes bacterium 4572_55]